MRHLIIFILTIGLLSCDNKKLAEKPKDKSEPIQKVNDIADSLDQNRTKLIIDTLTETEFISLFKEKQRVKYDICKDKSLKTNFEKSPDYWNQKMLFVNDTLRRIVVWGYPLSYKETNRKMKLLTTLGEGENQILIRLFTLDKNYNAVDNASITSSGGDEGVASWTLGEFKNDSTYLITEYMTGFETDSVESTTNSCLIIHWDGKIETIENCR